MERRLHLPSAPGVVLALALGAGAAGAATPFCEVVPPPGAPPLVAQAASELALYLGRTGTGPIPVVAAPTGACPTVLLEVTPAATALGPEGYELAPGPAPATPSLVVRAATPLGVLHGVYRLLREYGFGFYLDGDAVPPGPPAAFLSPTLRQTPVFAVRGSLVWYNFLNSPTTWDEHDFRSFADQLVRSGQNFLGFHTYDYEPFAAYEYEGRLVGGEPLQTTADRVWGTHPMTVDEFGGGTGRFFPGRHWGSDAARAAGTREERVRAQKALLARGLAYASARGLKTCLGFEVAADPTDPAEQRRFLARLDQLLRDYPMLDYVWLWQPEGRSVDGTPPPPLRSSAGSLMREWQEAFAACGSSARQWEGIRMAAYGRLAQLHLDSSAPAVRLVLAGWGGDHWLHVSDYFPAWDKVLDRRIVFAALDDIRVSPTVSRHYQLPPERERWAIPWYEYDGDQWFPQANAAVFADTVRDARAKGCQGLLAIHWRTKEVGESQALVSQYAWNPAETLPAFYRDYGLRRLGLELGPAFGDALRELDALGYRWLGGAGQSECGEFAWCFVNDPGREARLAEIRSRLAQLRAAVRPATCPLGAVGRADDALATIDRVLLYNRIAGWLIPGGPVDAALGLPEAGAERRAACAEQLRRLTGPEFADMLDLYARTITSRGELGVLATVNAKAFYDYHERVGRLHAGAGAAGPPPDLTLPLAAHGGVVSDAMLTTVAEGTPLPVRCVAFQGGSPATRVTLQYRAAGATDWTETDMACAQRAVFEAAIPAAAVRPGGVQYRVVARLGGTVAAWPDLRGEPFRHVHVFPAAALVARRNEVRATPPAGAAVPDLRARPDGPGLVRLSWTCGPGLPETDVERRGGPEGEAWARLAQTRDGLWTDAVAPPAADLRYRLTDGHGTELATAAVQTPPAPPPSAPKGLTARVRGTDVRLRWTGSDPTVARYSVERAAAAAGPWEPVAEAANLAPADFAPNAFTDHPRRDSTVWYRVRAHGLAADAAVAGEPVSAQPSARPPDPVLALEFDDTPPALPTGPLEFSGPQRVADGILTTDGGLAVPYGDALAVRDAFTVAIRFRQSQRTPMPVLISQGAWEGPGYFVQLYSHQLRFYVGGAGCLDTPISAEPGTWHTAVCVFDGDTLSSYWDGGPAGEKPATGAFRPATAAFTVARYTQVGPEWTFKGDVDFVRLFRAALEPGMALRRRSPAGASLSFDWSTPDVVVAGQKAEWHQPPRLAEIDGVRAADLQGGLTLPFRDTFPAGDRLRLETRFRLRRVDGMPVLVNQGLWPGEGYMLQVLGGRLRFHIGGVGSLDAGPTLAADRWYSVVCTYDGTVLRAALDGTPIGELAATAACVPSLRPLRLGRYEADAPQYVFDGWLGPTRITDAP